MTIILINLLWATFFAIGLAKFVCQSAIIRILEDKITVLEHDTKLTRALHDALDGQFLEHRDNANMFIAGRLNISEVPEAKPGM